VLDGGNPHHHVGHLATMDTIEAIARTIRDLHGNRPTTRVDKPAHRA